MGCVYRGSKEMIRQRDCETLAVFKRRDGSIWQIVGYWTQPVVKMVEMRTDGIKGEYIIAGIDGAMWDGFERLRPDNEINR
jgi:hypothetical protein